MERIEKTVFISYRRTNIPWALAIFQDLEKHGYDVFFDYSGIASGDFERVILENIAARAHFLVLLTPSALERCVDPADWLRREIEVALDNRRNVVPLLLEGFGFKTPKIADQLTGKLSALKQYNGLTIPPEYFHEAMQRLRNRYLNIPLPAVRHPASAAAHKAAIEQKAAAGAVPMVQERDLTAQELFERGFAATDRNQQLHFYAEAIRLQTDSAAAFNIGALRDAAEQIRFRPFEDARTYVHTLGLRSQAEWRDFARNGNRPEDIPWTPERTYKKFGWKSWGDWLGTGTIATQNRVFRDFVEARSYVRNLSLDSQKAWSEYRYSGKKPPEIPANPARHYNGKGWINWGDWLGTGRVAHQDRVYRRFRRARAFVHSLGLKTREQWKQYCRAGKNPSDIPANPLIVYQGRGWNGWGDWLGTGTVAKQNREYRSFAEARAFVRTLGLRSQTEWREVYCRSGNKPEDIPANPYNHYRKKGWTHWGDFLGTRMKAKPYGRQRPAATRRHS